MFTLFCCYYCRKVRKYSSKKTNVFVFSCALFLRTFLIKAWMIIDYWGLFVHIFKIKHILYYILYILCIYTCVTCTICINVASPISSSSTCLFVYLAEVFHPAWEEGEAEEMAVGVEGAPLCFSFGDWRAGTWNSWCAPKTNYRGPRPPAWLPVRPGRGECDR